MFCFNCGAQVADNAKFCGACGAILSQQAPVQPMAPQGGYTAPGPPVQGGNAVPLQGMPVPPFQGGNPAPYPGAPIPPVPNASYPNPVNNAPMNTPAPQGQPTGNTPNEYPAGDTVKISDAAKAAAENPAQPVGFQVPPMGTDMQFINNGGMNGGMPEGQNLFTNAQPSNYGMPMGVYREEVPMSYSQPRVKRVRKEVKKMKLSVSVILAAVFGLFAFVFGIFSFVGGTVRMGLSSGELSAEISELEIGKIVVGDILVQDSMADVVKDNGIVLPEKHPERATIADIAACTINDYVHTADLTADQINEIFRRAHVSEELSSLVKAYEEYIVTGNTEEFADGLCKEIKDLVKRSESNVINIAGMRLADDYEEQLDNALDGERNSIESILPGEALDGVSGLIRFALSPVTLIAALVLAVVLVVLEWVITKRVNAALMAGGAAFTLIGIILTAASIILSNLTMIGGLDYTVVNKVVSPMLYNTFGFKLLTGGLITLGVGLVLIAVFIVMKVLEKKRAAATPAEPQE